MDDVTRAYYDALDRTMNGRTHQDRSVGSADLGAILDGEGMTPGERDELQEEVGV